MEKPKIAVVNSSSELSSGFSHLDGVAATVKEGVRAAVGLKADEGGNPATGPGSP